MYSHLGEKAMISGAKDCNHGGNTLSGRWALGREKPSLHRSSPFVDEADERNIRHPKKEP
ncbi:MAG: hypothetical protein RSH25_16405 [Bacteroides sp.]|uniref:hypothetical protein n=1 Tax=Bacteroides sp. TaxID=29523 RepID=UPI002FCB0636